MYRRIYISTFHSTYKSSTLQRTSGRQGAGAWCWRRMVGCQATASSHLDKMPTPCLSLRNWAKCDGHQDLSSWFSEHRSYFTTVPLSQFLPQSAHKKTSYFLSSFL